MTRWQRWLRIPQDVGLRKLLFQIHLWTGIGIGLYIVLISLTGGVLVLVLAFTGAIIWWPGIRNWRRSLIVDLRSNWKRLNWSLHSALGIWFLAFVLMWGITGSYLSFPQAFYGVAEFLEPTDYTSEAPRMSDRVLYWLAYAHFGRFGRRLPGCGPTCDATLKAVWAAIALVPPVMFVTGVLMWWNRARRIPSAGVPRSVDAPGAGE